MVIRSVYIFVLLGLVCHQTTAFSCYQCSSTVNSENVEIPTETGNPCVEIGATTTVDAGNYACMTTFTKAEGSFSISRSVATFNPASSTRPHCTNYGDITTCYCSSDKCNNQKVSIDRTYNCYECSSSEYFNNGCGEKLDTTLGFVRTTSGCSACYKNVFVDSDMTVRYIRGCSRGIQIDDSCTDVSDGSFMKCACKKSLCNSAESHIISFSTAIAAVLLSAFLNHFY